MCFALLQTVRMPAADLLAAARADADRTLDLRRRFHRVPEVGLQLPATQAIVLEALLKAGAKDVVFGGIADRPATEACYKAGVGATIPLTIGATLDPYASKPVKVTATVKALLDGVVPAKREAAVQIDGVTLILSAYRRPYHEIVDFTKLGIDPKAAKILVVKSGYLEPQIKAIANPTLMALTDGAINQDIVHLPKNKYRPPTFPFVDDLTFTPTVYTSARAPHRP